jgi:GT2 family glycosyltransferase
VSRPRVDVVVPFRGSPEERQGLIDGLPVMRLGVGDTVTVVDNTPGHAEPEQQGPIRVRCATARLTPGYARNRGAELGGAEWIVFLDADAVPEPDLLERYFEPLPGESTGLLAGGVLDNPIGSDGPPAARYAELRRTLHQDRPLGLGDFAFAQTANLACRREAFTAIGGFREDIRAGEDADLNYRLRDAGWVTERREAARAVHFGPPTVRRALGQARLHGAGAAWVDEHYPGAFPRRRMPGLGWWAIRFAARHVVRGLVRQDRDSVVVGLMEPLWELAFERGRRRPALVEPQLAPEGAGTLRAR